MVVVGGSCHDSQTLQTMLDLAAPGTHFLHAISTGTQMYIYMGTHTDREVDKRHRRRPPDVATLLLKQPLQKGLEWPEEEPQHQRGYSRKAK